MRPLKTLEEKKRRKAETHKKWAIKNRVYRREYCKELKKRNPAYRRKCILALRRRLREKPWMMSYDCARTRCLNKNSPSFHRYGARGIKFLITPLEVKKIWIRDKAHKLKQATIDRIDNEGNYEISNCRFIEKSENCTKGNYEARWK